MKMRLLAGTAVAAVLAGNATYAADLPPPVLKSAPAMLPAPQFSWTGCYAGTNSGLGLGHNQFTDTQPDGNIDGNPASARTAQTDMSGGFLGGQGGCDLQFYGNWVVGFAGSINWSNIQGTNQDQFNAPWTLTNNINWFGAATARVGTVVYSPNILLYAKGGLAYAHEKLEIENSGVTLGTPSDVRIGWTAGAGLEWAFAPHLSAVIEGSYYGFGNKTETFNVVPGFINPPTTINVKPSFTTLSVGLNYRFGGP